MPAVDRQGQRTADPCIIEGLFLVVRGDEAAAIPVALLHGDIAVERPLEFITRRRREAPEFDRRAVRAYRVEPYCLLVGVDRLEAVEIRQPLAIVIGVAHAADRLPSLEFGEFERARAFNVLLVPAWIPIEDLLLVDEGERIGERREKRVSREFEVEDDSGGIRGLHCIDHLVPALAR